MYQYPHHIGDFNTKTRHLSRLERSIFRDMLDMYFDTELPLDGSDINLLSRRLLCRSPEEVDAMQFVLAEFFEQQDGGMYVNHDCETVIAQYRAQAAGRDAVKSNENARQERSRARRAAIFSVLRQLGIAPHGTAKMAELLELCRKHGVTVTEDSAHVTPPAPAADDNGSVTDVVTVPPVTCHAPVTGNLNLNHNQIHTPQPPSGGASGGLAIATALVGFFPEHRRTRLAEVAELVGELVAAGTVTGEALLAAAQAQQTLLAADDGKRCPAVLRWLREHRWMDSAVQQHADGTPSDWAATRSGVEKMAAHLGLPGYEAWAELRAVTAAPRLFTGYEAEVHAALARSKGVAA
ncbi:YdaU family protein [Comamonas sp.]|uniref:YdaU family protein n=1 Tax=Comamonas sp. TaxID=34028 RepID=UPI003A95A7FF